MRNPAPRALALMVTAVLGFGVLSFAKVKIPKDLPEKYQEWLGDVQVLISDVEIKAFLEIEKDYQRDAFIERFWEVRDRVESTERNEFRRRFYDRLADARLEFKDRADDRFNVYLLNGEAGWVKETDCGVLTWPLEVWNYAYSEHVGGGIKILFYQPGGGGPFRMWREADGYDVLLSNRTAPPNFSRNEERGHFYNVLMKYCSEIWDEMEALREDIREVEREGPMGPVRAEAPPQTDPEWLQTFRAFSTEVAAEAAELTAEVEFSFPGRHQSRTVVEGTLLVSAAQASAARLGDRESFNFQLTGEVLLEGQLFESFRYRFDLPTSETPEGNLSLLFERYLRPGVYSIVLRLQDLHGGGEFRDQRELEVPAVDAAELAADHRLQPAAGADGMTQPAGASEEPGVVLAADPSPLQSGFSRFTAEVTGAVHKVAFLLDDRAVMTKTRAPYSVELDLGRLPRAHTVRAVGYDTAGVEVATDEIVVNPGEHAFIVRLVEPRKGQSYSGSLRVRAEVEAPEGSLVERVELFLNDDRVATLYQPPYVQSITLAGEEVAFVRAVAVLQDGNSSDDLVLINAGDYLEDIQVRLVELYATVIDRAGRPIPDLERDDFRVLEDGQTQEVIRFERLDDLPIYAALLVDTSASMVENLDTVRRVALGFFEQTIESKDRAAIITFSDQPRLAAKFTNDMATVGAALAGLSAERSTALWDSVQFGLYYFQGVKGQRALVVLSDGEDRRSETTFDEALDYARSAGVTIYTVGLDISKRAPRSQLTRLAEETGGRAFFIDSIAELERIAATVQRDLRSRYLLAYQSPPAESRSFRVVDVHVSQSDAEVRTLRGYYP